MKLLFVCHGNICRSPMAEFVMKDLLEKAGRHDVVVESAALHTDELGHNTHYGTRRELDRHGITLNKNCVPGEKRSPAQASGVRIGCAAMTTKGWKEEDAVACAKRIHEIITALAAK